MTVLTIRSSSRDDSVSPLTTAAVIERASKKPYATFLREEIFRPLGMRHSGVIGVDRPVKGAVAYRGLVAQGSVSDWPRNWRTWGGGDVFSTASDLHRFARALRGTDFLPGAQRAKLFGRHVAMPEGEEHYAYGWFVAPEVVEHGGDTEKGFHCAFRIYGDGVTLILVGNRTEVNGPWQRWLVQDEIAAIARAKESKPLPVVRSGGGPADGTYRSADGGALVVRRHGKQLVLEARSQPAALSLWGAAADAEKLARAVAKTTTLLETAKTDPRAAFQGALTAAAEEHTDAYLDEWGSLVRDHGEYRGFSVSGAVPRGAAARVFAELQFARASVPMTFIFQDRGDGRLAGSRPGEGPPLARVFASESPSRFIAVHLASRERVVLDLRSGDGSDGFVLGGAEYRREPR